MLEELEQAGMAWSEVKVLARDRDGWCLFVGSTVACVTKKSVTS